MTVDRGPWVSCLVDGRLTLELKKSQKDLEEMREIRRRQKAVRRARQMELYAKLNIIRSVRGRIALPLLGPCSRGRGMDSLWTYYLQSRGAAW